MSILKCEAKGCEVTASKCCSICHSARYCSKKCQRDNWSIHKKECKELSQSFHFWTKLQQLERTTDSLACQILLDDIVTYLPIFTLPGTKTVTRYGWEIVQSQELKCWDQSAYLPQFVAFTREDQKPWRVTDGNVPPNRFFSLLECLGNLCVDLEISSFSRNRSSSSLGMAKDCCKICYSDSVTVCLTPCGHLLCSMCSQKCSSCPFCRGKFIPIKMFFH